MKDMAVQAAAASQQNNWPQDQVQLGTSAVQEEDGEAASIRTLLDHAEEESKSLQEMIKDAQEKAEAHRNAMKMPKSNTRYGDAPLEAYARLARARSAAEVNAASGFARRRIAQFKSSLRLDSDNSAKIKAAINQLQKAVTRGEKKKRDLDREKRLERQKTRSKEAEQRLKQELRRRKTQRIIRESGYLREAEISDRLATQLTATQMELRLQAQAISSATAASMETAVQQYTDAASAGSEAAAPAPASVQGFI